MFARDMKMFAFRPIVLLMLVLVVLASAPRPGAASTKKHASEGASSVAAVAAAAAAGSVSILRETEGGRTGELGGGGVCQLAAAAVRGVGC